MDATLAVSEAGVKHLMDRLIGLASASNCDSDGWGPFEVSYSASVTLAEVPTTAVELINDPVNHVRLDNVNVSGAVGASFTFDLGKILPKVCIPPFQVCGDIPLLGTVCTPQWCVPWPSKTVGVYLPFSFNVSAEFGISVKDGGANWDVTITVFPFLTSFDLTPMAGIITDAISKEITGYLGTIPGIGDLITDLVNMVLGALSGVITLILDAFSALINAVIKLINLFDPLGIPLGVSVAKSQPFLPSGFPSPTDPEVDVTVTSLDARVLDRELVASAAFA